MRRLRLRSFLRIRWDDLFDHDYGFAINHSPGKEADTVNDTKSPFKSQTFWASLILIIVAIAQGFGFQITEADTAEAQGHVYAIITGALGLWAMIGRIRATKKIEMPKASDSFAFAIVLVPAFALTGCTTLFADTPAKRYATQVETLNAVEQSIVSAYDLGTIGSAHYVELYKLIKVARAAVDTARVELDAGRSETFEARLRTASATVNELVKQYEAAPVQSPGADDVTEPSGGQGAIDGHRNDLRDLSRGRADIGSGWTRARAATPGGRSDARAVGRAGRADGEGPGRDGRPGRAREGRARFAIERWMTLLPRVATA